MQFSMRDSIAFLSLIASASAAEQPIMEGIFHKRQNVGTGASASDTAAAATSTPPPAAATTSTPTTVTSESTETSTIVTTSNNTPTTAVVTSVSTTSIATSAAAPATSAQNTSAAPTSNAPSATAGAGSGSGSGSSTRAGAGSGSESSSKSSASTTKSNTSKTTITSALIGVSTSQDVVTIATTVDGKISSFTSTSQTVLSSTTGYSTVTTAPAILSGSNDGGSTGLSSKSKGIIGGVVGGIGGAILLGGIALVCWRIWGRKKNNANDYDDFSTAGTAVASSPGHKRESSGVADDEAHADRYTSPLGRPNAAANF